MSDLGRGFRLGFGFALGAAVVAVTVLGTTRAVSVLRSAGWRVTLTRALTAQEGGEGSIRTGRVSAEPLELLSLEAERQGGRIALSGSVRNTSSHVLTGLRARVTLQDEQGQVVSHTEVPLRGGLAPGRTSTFTTSVVDDPEIVRYRVTFAGRGGEPLRFRDGRTTAGSAP